MRILCLLIIQSCLLAVLSSCGGGVSGENGSDPFGDSGTDSSETLKIGHFDTSGQFVEDVVGVNLTAVNGIYEISAGGSIGLSLVVVDEDNARVSNSYSVSFSSNCVIAQQASIDSEINTVNGEASSTYTDLSCAGSSGTVDQISATVVIDDETLTATQEITILPEVIGSISFVSASPESILLQGAGDASASISNVTFLVSNDQAEAIEGQVVEFSLSTEIGGLALDSTSGVTNTDGEVVAEVIAGNVPTAVRVNATVEGANGESLNTQSDAIAVTTGQPNQRNFSLGAEILNIEGANQNGQVTAITARLADTFGNPVPDNTLVTFTAEGGLIESSCLTESGACSVDWTSADPRASNGLVTILATAIGHETLFDSNGNNAFDDEDGGVIDELVSTASGFGTTATGETGFVDYSEAWRDDNENGHRDSNEPFLDYNNNMAFDEADGLFNGSLCVDSALCGEGIYAANHVRKALRLVVSGSEANIDALDADEMLLASNYQDLSDPEMASIARGVTTEFSISVSDENANVMPAETTIDISADEGELTVFSSTTVSNVSSSQPTVINFFLENNLAEDDAAVVANLIVTVTTPLGIESGLQFSVSLQ